MQACEAIKSIKPIALDYHILGGTPTDIGNINLRYLIIFF